MTLLDYIQAIKNQRVALVSASGKEIARTQNLEFAVLDSIQLSKHHLELFFDETRNKGIIQETFSINQNENAALVKACITLIKLEDQEYLNISVSEIITEKVAKADFNQKTLLNQLKLIIENSASVTTLYQIDGTPVYISSISKQIFGYTPDELMQKPSYFGIIDEDRPAYFAYVQEITEGRNLAEGLDFRFKKKDGDVVWLNIKMNPVYDVNGKITHIQSGTRDINDSKLYQLKLKKSEETARAIINSSNSAILLVDRNNIIISANDRAKVLALQIFGQPIGVGFNAETIAALSKSSFYKKDVTAAFNGETTHRYEKIQLRHSQKEIWFHLQFIPVWSDDGSINSVCWNATDISDEKKSEEYTISLLQRLNLANNAGEIGIWEFDFMQQIAKFDDQCLRLFDHKIDVKATLPNWTKHYKKEYRLSLFNILNNEVKKEKEFFDIELELADENSQTKFHQLKGRIIFKNNKPVSATGVLIDITAAKKTEKNLEKSRNQLNLAQRLAKMGGFEIEIESRSTFWSENNFQIHHIQAGKAPSLATYLRSIHKDDLAAFLNILRTAKKSNHLQELVYRYIAQNGLELTFSLRIKAVFYRNKLTKFVGTVQDITDNTTLQKSLEHKENQLSDNQKRLSEYSFMNSHKVRAPLSNILGIIQLMRIEQSPELVDMLERSAEELDKVIHEANEILAE